MKEVLVKMARLAYNDENDRYGILSMDLWDNEGLHCGESLEVFLNGEWIADRIELKQPNTWYLVETKISGSDLEGLKVRKANK